jgi:hypothetical protein
MRETRSWIKWMTVGGIAQLAMIITGHYNAFVKDNLFAIVGMVISLLAGAMFGRSAANKGAAAGGGAVVGGLCAFVGIAASVALGDTEAFVLVFGTASSVVTGLLGGVVARALAGTRAQPRLAK